MSDLLPCPFCGAAGEEDPGLATGDFAVRCIECDSGTSLHDDPRDAIAAWNRRASTPHHVLREEEQ